MGQELGSSVDAKQVIQVEALSKSFGEVVAVDGVDFVVPEASVLGLLGPNGSGKTTIVRILTTALHPDSGRAVVGGHDVVHDAAAVRHMIGLAGQYAAVDPNLTGRENLEMVGRLHHVSKRDARLRATELLERFDLADAAADRPTRMYSGGMRRRLDVAASLTSRPSVLFLDEPTTGLDPRSRRTLWEVIEELVAEGTTVLLTTQYLEEADRLADQIVVLDAGRVVAAGTAHDLKQRIGTSTVTVTTSDPTSVPRAIAAMEPVGAGAVIVDGSRLRVAVPRGAAAVVAVLGQLAAAGIDIDDVEVTEPTLDDVFLAITTSSTEVEETRG